MAKLNRRFDSSHRLYEIKHCYGLIQFEGKWNLKARVNSTSLVESLSTSHKGMYEDFVVITSVMELDPQNEPVPGQFNMPGL